jgi:hypothetical protein
MILNSRNSNFIVNFPKGWFYKEVEDKYKIYLKRFPVPYTNLTSFVNYSIQSCTFPAFTAETVEQSTQNMHTTWKGGFDLDLYVDKQITITFKTTESFVNYFAMMDQFTQFYHHTQVKEFLPPITLHLLDHHGFLSTSFLMRYVVMNSMSELELSYSSDTPEFRTFDVNFQFSLFEVKNHFA